MATVVNNDTSAPATDGGLGMIMGVILAIIALFVIGYFALPMVRGGAMPNTNNGVNPGANTQPGTTENKGAEVNIPDKIDVNVNQNPTQ